VFPDIQQEVVLLLCEKNGNDSHLIEYLEVRDASELTTLNELKNQTKRIDGKTDKWTYYFLEREEIDFLESIAEARKIPTIENYANVEAGIKTGANNYFTVPDSTVTFYQLEQFARPLVGRGVKVNGVVFTKEDWFRNVQADTKANLLVFPPKLNEHAGAKDYIQYGESIGISKRCTTNTRKDWYVISTLKLSEVLFTRFIHLYPRLVLNAANAHASNTMLRIYTKPTTNKNAFVASFYNSLSLAFSEVVGRRFGGGVLDIIPNEAKQILLPYHTNNSDLLPTIDQMMREKTSIDDILQVTNKQILQDGYGLTDNEIQLADSIWKKLAARRLNRKK
jgi:adenine-specific DNA methylase